MAKKSNDMGEADADQEDMTRSMNEIMATMGGSVDVSFNIQTGDVRAAGFGRKFNRRNINMALGEINLFLKDYFTIQHDASHRLLSMDIDVIVERIMERMKEVEEASKITGEHKVSEVG